MSDTLAPAPPTMPGLEVLADSIAREVSNRAERLQRIQSLGTRFEAARAKAAEVLKELADIKTAFAAETGGASGGVPLAPQA